MNPTHTDTYTSLFISLFTYLPVHVYEKCEFHADTSESVLFHRFILVFPFPFCDFFLSSEKFGSHQLQLIHLCIHSQFKYKIVAELLIHTHVRKTFTSQSTVFVQRSFYLYRIKLKILFSKLNQVSYFLLDLLQCGSLFICNTVRFIYLLLVFHFKFHKVVGFDDLLGECEILLRF